MGADNLAKDLDCLHFEIDKSYRLLPSPFTEGKLDCKQGPKPALVHRIVSEKRGASPRPPGPQFDQAVWQPARGPQASLCLVQHLRSQAGYYFFPPDRLKKDLQGGSGHTAWPLREGVSTAAFQIRSSHLLSGLISQILTSHDPVRIRKVVTLGTVPFVISLKITYLA